MGSSACFDIGTTLKDMKNSLDTIFPENCKKATKMMCKKMTELRD